MFVLQFTNKYDIGWSLSQIWVARNVSSLLRTASESSRCRLGSRQPGFGLWSRKYSWSTSATAAALAVGRIGKSLAYGRRAMLKATFA